MKNIIFLGSKAIGLECLKYLFNQRFKYDYNLAGVLTNSRGQEVSEFCVKNNIILLKSLDDILSLKNIDIGISIQYHQILMKKHIQIANDIFINLHMAPLPEYRGCNQFSFCIINGDNEFGTTIHLIEEGIDSGAILFEDRFKINDNIWVEDLYKETYEKSLNLFKISLPKIINNEYKLTEQNNLIGARTTSIHYRKSINAIKKINLSWDKEKVLRYIRATSMPGFEPPYYVKNGIKIPIHLSKNNFNIGLEKILKDIA